jgi:hypothetical protein
LKPYRKRENIHFRVATLSASTPRTVAQPAQRIESETYLEWTDPKNRHARKPKDGHTDKTRNRQTGKETDRKSEKRAEREGDKQPERKTERQTPRQTDRERDSQTFFALHLYCNE